MASATADNDMKPVDNHVEQPKEAAEEDEEVTPEKKAKRRRGSSEVIEAEGMPVDRPSRERKTVKRYSAVSPKKASATKSLLIKQGSGTKLMDIPNVVFKLSKRKVDDNLQALHKILFGRKSNVHQLKRNIFQFSGFIWPENEEKLRARLKERLDKYNKDKLVDFCELLDIHALKASTKKEEVTAKLLEFLESPHITRDVLLSEKAKKGKKRARKTKGESSSGITKKKMKSSEPEVEKRKRRPSKVEEQQEDEDGSTGKDASSDEEGGGTSEEEMEQVNSEDANDETEKPVTSKKGHTEKAERIDEPKIEENNSLVIEGSPAKSSKIPIRPASKKASIPAEDEPEVDVDSKQGSTKEQTRKVSKATSKEKGAKLKKEDTNKSQRKGSFVDVSEKGLSSSSKSTKEDKKKAKSNEKPVFEEKKARKKKEDKSRSRVPNKEQGKRKTNGRPSKTNGRPSAEELRSVISNILKEVDFNTATLADILKQLGAHFKVDLMDRKTEVKQIIEEVINSMTDEEEEDIEGSDKEGDQEEEESDEDGEK